MGLDSSEVPPLPAPTDTDSVAPTEVITDVTADFVADEVSDVSKIADEKSSYSLPSDGTPVTIKTRSHLRPDRSQTSLLIEYFEGSKPGTTGSTADRKPDVRVRLIPSKRGRNDHIQITESKGSRKTSLSRKRLERSERSERSEPVVSTSYTPHQQHQQHSSREALDVEDARSMASYASATEESTVSRNPPIDIEIDRSNKSRSRRPTSPLIPSVVDSKASYQPNPSEISDIPADPYFDNAGGYDGQRESRDSGAASNLDPLVPTGAAAATISSVAAAAAAVGAAAAARANEKMADSRVKFGSRENVSSTTEKYREKPTKQKSGKSRSRVSSGEKERPTESHRRRSSRNQESDQNVSSSHHHHTATAAPRYDQHSTVSTASKASSVNNPKLLETVEDAIRRLILPELSLLREQSTRQQKRDRRSSLTSTGTSLSREDLTPDHRKSADRRSEVTKTNERRKNRRDREVRHDYGDSSPVSFDRDSAAESLPYVDDALTPIKGNNDGNHAQDAAGDSIVTVAATTFTERGAGEERRQRRRRRADHTRNSRGLGMGGDAATATDDYLEHQDYYATPTMPLMSEINASEVTRTSLLTADTDRPHSAAEEHKPPLHEVIRGVMSADSTPTRDHSPAFAQQPLVMRHANVSHGDLTTLARRRTGEYEGAAARQMAARVDDKLPPDHPLEREYAEDDYDDAEYDQDYPYTQLPPPENYPFQQHVLSPIPSEAEDRSEVQDGESRRGSRTSYRSETPHNRPHSSSSYPGHPIISRDLDQSVISDLQTPRASEMDPRTTVFTEASDVGQQAVNRVGASPNLVNVPFGVESAVASLVDGSVMTASFVDGPRDSAAHEEGQHLREPTSNGYSPSKLSSEIQHDEWTTDSIHPAKRHDSREAFREEYEPDEYGRKHRRDQQVSPAHSEGAPSSQQRQSPTASEAAITAGAVAALKAKSRKAQVEDAPDADFVGEGVGRNKSFKERTMDGRGPVSTPTRSVDRFDNEESLRMAASGLPDWDNPMPEAEYVQSEDGRQQYADEMDWSGAKTPTRLDRGGDRSRSEDIVNTAAALTTAAVMAAAGNQDDDQWHDNKRDTLVTNPYEDASPVANPALHDNLIGNRGFNNFGPGYATGSPGLQHRALDEGYMSQDPNRTPEPTRRGPNAAVANRNGGDHHHPYVTAGNGIFPSRHMSGLSQGMQTPIYDGSAGLDMDNIESKDIYTLVQFLISLDARRHANEGTLVQAVIQATTQMQNSFGDFKRLLHDTRDEINDNTDRTVHKAINGPRPYPGAARSMQGSSHGDSNVDEFTVKKQSIFRRALKGLSAKGTNDLSRIEEMLNQLLVEVDALKTQTTKPASRMTSSPVGPSFDNLQPEVPAEDHGYEPEGHAGTSTASASQSGHLSIPQPRGSVPTRGGYERKFSDHRISTVPEDNEDDYDRRHSNDPPTNIDPKILVPTALATNRAGSEPPLTSQEDQQQQQQHVSGRTQSYSNETTPKTNNSKKVKSGSAWFPKISRWSETTTSSVGRVFRTSKKDSKDTDYNNSYQRSRSASESGSGSGSESDDEDDNRPSVDPYGDDRLHSGFSMADLPGISPHDQYQMSGALEEEPPSRPTFTTPEDPKYKAHRNSINLQHPQPRAGPSDRYRNALEFSAQEFNPETPRSADWGGSLTSLNRLPPNANRYSASSGGVVGDRSHENWVASSTEESPAPPRPPKEPLDSMRSPPQSGRISGRTNNSGSPKPENRHLNTALGAPARRPTGPRAMTPTNEKDSSRPPHSPLSPREERRRKRDTFGSIASRDSDGY